MYQPLSYIHPGAKIAKNVVIEPFTSIDKNVVIGEGSWIGSNVTIMSGARIGKNVSIFPGSVISAVPQDLKFKGEKNSLEIGENNLIREYVTINPGTEGGGSKTIIGNNCLFMISSHVAHDCEIEDDVVLSNQAALAGSVKVGKGVILGGYAIVHQYCFLGEYSFCAMGSAVNKDIPAYVKVRGNPAKPFGINSVGVKRLGYSSETIESLKSAYRTFYRKKLTTDEALLELKSSVTISPEVSSSSSTRRGQPGV